jgi:hypothetical protein
MLTKSREIQVKRAAGKEMEKYWNTWGQSKNASVVDGSYTEPQSQSRGKLI